MEVLELLETKTKAELIKFAKKEYMFYSPSWKISVFRKYVAEHLTKYPWAIKNL